MPYRPVLRPASGQLTGYVHIGFKTIIPATSFRSRQRQQSFHDAEVFYAPNVYRDPLLVVNCVADYSWSRATRCLGWSQRVDEPWTGRGSGILDRHRPAASQHALCWGKFDI